MNGTYSFQDVTATLTGPTGSIDMGYGAAAAEEGITIAMKDAKNTMLIGADGEGMHSLSAAKAGEVTVRLLKTSPVNAKLMAAYDAQELTASLWGKNIITIRQVASGDITTCRTCAFRKKPDLHYKKDGDIMEWIFDSVKVDSILGSYN